MKEIFLSPLAYSVYAFIALMLLRFMLNYYYLLQTATLFKKYNNYLAENTWEFNQNVPTIVDLFRKAGIKEAAVNHQEFLGYGNFANVRVSTFNNITSGRADIVSHILAHFHQAIGVYRKRALDSLNPIFWIEFIFRLPEHLLSFMGVLPEKMVVKVFQLAYWLVAILFGLEKLDIINIFKSLKSY